MPTTTPLTDAINALTRYANETTGASDTTLSDAVGTLVAGYGQGGGGEWTTDGIANGSEPSGAITISASVSTIVSRAFFERTGITSVTLEGSPFLGNYAFSGCSNMETLYAPGLEKMAQNRYNTAQYVFQNCKKLKAVAFPSYTNQPVDSYNFQNCTSLEAADFAQVQRFGNTFVGCTALRTLVLRGSAVATLNSGWSANSLGGIYSNPTASTVYVPSAMISSYQTASGWSNAYSAGVTFAAIEGSQYETAYADGTPIE